MMEGGNQYGIQQTSRAHLAATQSTVAHLADEFHVSFSTIHSGIREIMLEHPMDAIM